MAVKKPDGALIPSRRVKSKIVAQVGGGQVERDLQVVVESTPLAAPQAFRNQGYDRKLWVLPCVANTNLICIGDSQLKAPGEYRYFKYRNSSLYKLLLTLFRGVTVLSVPILIPCVGYRSNVLHYSSHAEGDVLVCIVCIAV